MQSVNFTSIREETDQIDRWLISQAGRAAQEFLCRHSLAIAIAEEGSEYGWGTVYFLAGMGFGMASEMPGFSSVFTTHGIRSRYARARAEWVVAAARSAGGYRAGTLLECLTSELARFGHQPPVDERPAAASALTPRRPGSSPPRPRESLLTALAPPPA